jgi:hypothetical protein
MELSSFARYAPQSRTDGNLRLSHIRTEIRSFGAHAYPDYDVYICDSNMAFWKIVMQGQIQLFSCQLLCDKPLR